MSDVDEMLLADDLNVIQEWLDGKVNWNDLSPEIQSAIDEVMLELSDEQTEEPVEAPVEIATAEIVKQQEPDANLELLHKANEEQRFTLGPWYIPNRYDAHGEWTDADELQKSLWDYVKSGDRGIRLQHNKDIVAGEWVEAMAFPVPITIGMSKDAVSKQVEYPAGTVFLGVQWKPWAWELVKAGKIQGFSIGGAAARIDMGMTDAMAKATFASRSEAGRYAANQRWKDHISDRVRGYAQLTTVNTEARLAEARRKKLEREKTGVKKPSLIDRVKYYMSDEYTNPESLARREMRLYREADLKVPNSPIDRRGGSEAIMLPNGRMVTIQGKKISTQPFLGGEIVPRGGAYQAKLGKSVDQIKAEMRVNARVADAMDKASFGGNRSEAGRYAANMRWMNHSAKKVAMAGTGEFELPSTVSGVQLARMAPSLMTHADLDAIASELSGKNLTFDSVNAPLIVFNHLSKERQIKWLELIDDGMKGVPRNLDRKPNIYVLGGGGGAGKSSSPKGTVPISNKDSAQPREAVLINSDDFKENLPLYDAMQKSTEQDKKKAAASVHEESSLITAMGTTAALQTGRDVVVDGTFDNGAEKSLSKLDIMKGLGAGKIFGYFFSCDTNEAQRRAVKRYKDAKAKGEEARYVPVAPLRKAHISVSKNFLTYVKSGKFDSIVLTDTNGKKGEEFQMFKWDRSNGEEILNAPAFERFLSKQNDPIKPSTGGN